MTWQQHLSRYAFNAHSNHTYIYSLGNWAIDHAIKNQKLQFRFFFIGIRVVIIIYGPKQIHIQIFYLFFVPVNLFTFVCDCSYYIYVLITGRPNKITYI